MSALQISWLTNHYEQGKITSEEFTSLYRQITLAEKQIKASNAESFSTGDMVSNGKSKRKVMRLHPETRRSLARVRSFKGLARLMSYTMVVAFISIVYLSAEHYQVTGSLPSASIDGLEKLLTQAPREPLPSDFKLAAEYLSGQTDWHEVHVQQLSERWQNMQVSEREQYLDTDWFKALQLSLSLHIIEMKSLARQGDRLAIQQAALLTQLAKNLEKLPV